MKIICLNSSAVSAPRTTHVDIVPLTINNTTHHGVSISIRRPVTLIKTIPQQSNYKTQLLPKPFPKTNPTISAPEKDRKSCFNTSKNTVSDVLRLMDGLGLVVTADIYASLVNECTQNRDSVQAAELYTHFKQNHCPCGLLLLNRFLMMLVVCGCLDVAHQLFEEMPRRNCVSLAIMVTAAFNNQLFDKVLDLCVDMHRCLMYKPSHKALQVVLVCVLKSCVHLKNLCLGKMVHGWLLKMGYGRELFVGTALMEFYGKFGCLSEANFVFFDQVEVGGRCDTVLWTGTIVNHCREECFEEVLWIFREMGRAGVRKNEYTISSVLKACGRVDDDGCSYGRQVHANAIKLALDTHVFVMCGLVDMYGRCGLLEDAKNVFDMISHEKRNSVCWNAMATSFVQKGMFIEALQILYQMKAAGLQPQESLINEVRIACGSDRMSTRRD